MPRESDSAVDEQTAASIADPQPAEKPAAEAPAPAVVSTADPQQDVAPVDDPADEPEPDFRVSLVPDSGIEAPVAITVPGIYADLTPLPHPDDIKDANGDFLPGYDEHTPTLVETEAGWERPEGDTPEPTVPVDEYGRLVIDKPVTVPSALARVLQDTPYLKIEQVRS
jgi:hypothetical protein